MNKDMAVAIYDRTQYKLVPTENIGSWVNGVSQDGFEKPTALIKTVLKFAPEVKTSQDVYVNYFDAAEPSYEGGALFKAQVEVACFNILAKCKAGVEQATPTPNETKGPLTRAFNEIFTAIGVPTGAESAASFYKPPAPPPPTNPFNESMDKALPELHGEFLPDGQLVEAPSESDVRFNFAAPCGAGVKDDSSKPPMHLIDGYALEQLANVLAFGAEKYAPHNWRKGLAQTRLISAAMRHLSAFNGGQDTDPETGLHHAAHAMCCCMFMVWMSANKPQFDDRYKGDAA